jgi:hypothetical protein
MNTGLKVTIIPNDDGSPRRFDATQLRGESSAEAPVHGVILAEPARDGTVRVQLDDPYGWAVLPLAALVGRPVQAIIDANEA